MALRILYSMIKPNRPDVSSEDLIILYIFSCSHLDQFQITLCKYLIDLLPNIFLLALNVFRS